jgi:hypothetical protein
VKPRGPESGGFRRIRDTGAVRTIMDTNAMRTLMDTAAMQILRDRFAGRGRVIAGVLLGAWVIAGVVAVVALYSHQDEGTPKASASSAAPARTHPSATVPATPRPTPGRPGKKLPPAVVLQVASVQAFGPNGTSDGDNPDEAASVISGATSHPWHTKWYATAHFGNLQRGTGLLLDMGSRVTVTKITLNLAAGSADVIIRAGNGPVPGALTEIAHGTVAGGTVSLPVARMASARYVEIWFASLPQDAQGTYQESVYGVQVTGRA